MALDSQYMKTYKSTSFRSSFCHA